MQLRGIFEMGKKRWGGQWTFVAQVGNGLMARPHGLFDYDIYKAEYYQN